MTFIVHSVILSKYRQRGQDSKMIDVMIFVKISPNFGKYKYLSTVCFSEGFKLLQTC